MKILKKKPGFSYFLKEIPNTLEAMQAEVGGYIEVVPVDRSCAIICNEEGRLKGMTYNTKLAGIDFVGPIFLVGMDGPEFCDVPSLVAEILEVKA